MKDFPLKYKLYNTINTITTPTVDKKSLQKKVWWNIDEKNLVFESAKVKTILNKP